jgi:hypothetical protein
VHGILAVIRRLTVGSQITRLTYQRWPWFVFGNNVTRNPLELVRLYLPRLAIADSHDFDKLVHPLAPIGSDNSVGTTSPRGAATLTQLYDGTVLIYGGGAWPQTLPTGFVYTPQ